MESEAESSDRIASAVGRLRRDLEGTEGARGTDPTARARLIDGLKVETSDPNGNSLRTDMPEAIGGEATAMTPGTAMRAALASCDATMIAIEAAARGIALAELEVSVSSSSDHRGMLGIAGVDPQPEGFDIVVHLVSAEAGEEQLRALVEDALQRSPVGRALEQEIRVDVSVEIGPREDHD